MLVYGDHERVVAAEEERDSLLERADRLRRTGGLRWHGDCAALFVTLAGLLQGHADAGFQTRGIDEEDPAQAVLTAMLIDLARALDASWTSGFTAQHLPASLWRLATPTLASRLTIRRCEGLAYYALYPEMTLAAARGLPADTVVIGLRSIGTALAPLVAAACGSRTVHTLRPVGPPFARTPAIGPMLAAALHADRHRPFAVVDEGPGLSGSSFGGTADWLAAIGVARTRITLLPSHAGEPGAAASAAHRRQWRAAPRRVADFAEAVLHGPAPLAGWFADLVGPATAPLEDLSGGHWRRHAPWPDAPVDPGREARKYRLTTATGRYLLKFAGLDAAAADKFARARRLFAAGFVPEPLALRHGMIIEHWMPAARAATTADILAVAPRYLAHRADALPAVRAGASLHALVAMARQNIAEAGHAPPAIADAAQLDALQTLVRPVQVDARLQSWEWLATADGILKADAVDHAEAHDLVGCQDIAWDVAGLVAEYTLDAAARAALIAAVMPDRAEADALVAVLEPCYLAFQLGWWSFAPGDAAARHRALCLARVEAWLDRGPNALPAG